MANVIIDIAAEFTGKKGFKQAETATDKMSKNVKKLAGALGLAFSGQQILAFGKASIKAAADDEKAQKQLALALKNVGLSRDAAASEDFIQKLQSEFGILDDKLRPAYQTLAVATRDTAESQKLLQLALDISASTGKDLGSVTSALSKAYLGNNTALSKLGVGISKADLKAKSFKDITDELSTTFAGAATQSANTFQGSMDKLGVASANVKEIIGTGLIDALKALGEDDSVSTFAKDMENTALYIADIVRGVGQLITYVKQAGDAAENIPVLNKVLEAVLSTPFFWPTRALNKLGSDARKVSESQETSAQALNHLAELQSNYVIKTLSNKKKLTAEEAKALKAAKLKLALEKANLALNKGQDVFDMDKIQIAAALTNQAEQLGKATSAAQALQIANDTARLNVKKSILALEDAIAAKDEASILKATEKLNADLKILGALSGQNVKLQDIKSILDSLKSKDLINLANLDAAIAKMMELLKLQNTKPTETQTKTQTQTNTAGLTEFQKWVADKPADVSTADLFADLQGNQKWWETSGGHFKGFEPFVGANIPTMAPTTYGGSGAGLGGNGSGLQIPREANVNITVNTGIGDPNAIAEAIDQVLIDAVQRGTLRSGSY